MKKIFIVLFALLLVSCSSEDISYQVISADQAYENLKNDETIILLDVRSKEEYDDLHIVGAELLPLDLIESDAESVYTDKNQVIYVYCRSGNRSKTASEKLIDLGYKNIYDLGGIIDWPYDVE